MYGHFSVFWDKMDKLGPTYFTIWLPINIDVNDDQNKFEQDAKIRFEYIKKSSTKCTLRVINMRMHPYHCSSYLKVFLERPYSSARLQLIHDPPHMKSFTGFLQFLSPDTLWPWALEYQNPLNLGPHHQLELPLRDRLPHNRPKTSHYSKWIKYLGMVTKSWMTRGTLKFGKLNKL